MNLARNSSCHRSTSILLLLVAVPAVAGVQGVKTAILQHVIKNPGGVLSIAFSPDGNALACGGELTLRLYHVESGGLVRTFTDPMSIVNSVAFSPDGSLLASAGDDGVITIWEVETGHMRQSILAHSHEDAETSHDYRIFSLSFSPDGARLASGSGGFECFECLPYGEVNLWDISTGKPLLHFPARDDYVWSLSFSPDGEILANSAGDDVDLWHARSGTHLKNLSGHNADVLSVAFSASGRNLVTSSKDRTVMLWSTEDWTTTRRFRGHNDEILSVASVNENVIAAVGGTDEELRFWHVKSNLADSVIMGHDGFANTLALSRDGKRLAVGFSDGVLMIWTLHGHGHQ